MKQPVLLLLLITSLTSGCSRYEPAPTSPQTNAPTTSLFGGANTPATDSSHIQVDGASTQPAVFEKCSNRLYPVHNGAWWMYSLSSGERPSRTMFVSNDNTFTVAVKNGDVTLAFKGLCTSEGVVLLEVPQVVASHFGGATVTAQGLEGVTLPNDVQTGSTWVQRFNINNGNMSATIETNYHAISYETVNISVGSFHALKVEQSSMVNIGGQVLNTHGFLWYAQDIGVIKSVTDGTDSAELFSYNFP